MEIVIVICLLIVIALLVQDKIVIKKSSERKPIQEKSNPKLPDIMGQPRPKRRRIQDLNATRSVNILIIKFSFLFQFSIISE